MYVNSTTLLLGEFKQVFLAIANKKVALDNATSLD